MANFLSDRATNAKFSNKLLKTAKSQPVKKCCPIGQFLLLFIAVWPYSVFFYGKQTYPARKFSVFANTRLNVIYSC